VGRFGPCPPVAPVALRGVRVCRASGL
jgi:hypothetical protein